jgi:uncharacterized repeat protein (TIGR02543 family)
MYVPTVRRRSAFAGAALTWLLSAAIATSSGVATASAADDSAGAGEPRAAPFYSLTVSASPAIGGLTYPSGTSFRAAGTTVSIYAYNNYDHQFVGWTGTGVGSYTGSNRTATVTMNGNITQTANFQFVGIPLTMVAGPGGSVTPPSANYAYGAVVMIQAHPDSGYAFVKWTASRWPGYTGINNPATITMWGPVTQTATFGPGYTLSMAADPGGTVTPTPGDHFVAVGSQVSIQATPDPGYAFIGWTGTGTGSITTWQNPVTVTVNNDMSQMAHFAPRDLVPLTMMANPGGTVAPPSGNYYVGTILSITQTPNPGWLFSDWVGTGLGSYTGQAAWQPIMILGPITQTANFVFPQTWPVTMNAGAGGTVSPSSGDYPNGQPLTITALPAPGYAFKVWSGSGQGSYNGAMNPATILVNGPITQGALFTIAEAITLTTSPAGLRIGVDGVNYVSPRTFDWVGGTLHAVNVDSIVVAGPGDRNRFVQWSDGLKTVARTIYVPRGPATFTATYAHEYELDFQDPPEGTSQPGDGYRTAGSAVQITAVPSPGFAFVQWTGTGSGSYTGTANPATVTMNGSITQAPSFRPLGYEFSISASATDPLVNTDVPTGGVRVLSLWMVCSDAGISALEADVTGDLPVLGFAPAGGVLNIGTSTALLLAIPGCATTGSLLLGSLIVNDTGGTLCLGPSAANGILGAVDCQTFGPSTPQVTGFASNGTSPCVVAGNACGTVIVPETAGETARSESPVQDAAPVLPVVNAFLGARPNPFAGRTELHFAVASPDRVRFSIYDVTGRLVRWLVDEEMPAGEHLRSWDGRAADGSRAAGGVYFVRLQIGSFRQTERIVLMRSGE